MSPEEFNKKYPFVKKKPNKFKYNDVEREQSCIAWDSFGKTVIMLTGKSTSVPVDRLTYVEPHKKTVKLVRE